jgi:multiple antibiotic resistance protein
MEQHFTLFIGTFTTLLAVVNPLEALPVFLTLTQNHEKALQRKLAFRACSYAFILMIAFLLFGTFILKIFGVDLSMVRTVGGIILIKIGFDLFMPGQKGGITDTNTSATGDSDPAFVPMAMPIMFGPGVLATVLGMTSLKSSAEEIFSLLMIAIAALACMLVMYVILTSADKIVKRIGKKGIDAATRITGFFVATMGMGLIFHGLSEFLKTFHF